MSIDESNSISNVRCMNKCIHTTDPSDSLCDSDDAYYFHIFSQKVYLCSSCHEIGEEKYRDYRSELIQHGIGKWIYVYHGEFIEYGIESHAAIDKNCYENRKESKFFSLMFVEEDREPQENTTYSDIPCNIRECMEKKVGENRICYGCNDPEHSEIGER